jgi:hypothetical protein
MFGRYIKDSIVVAPTMPQNDYFCSGSHFSLHSHPTFPTLGISFPYTLTLLFLSSDPLFPTFSPSFPNARSFFSLHSHPPFLRSNALFPTLSLSFPGALCTPFPDVFVPLCSFILVLFSSALTLFSLRSQLSPSSPGMVIFFCSQFNHPLS